MQIAQAIFLSCGLASLGLILALIGGINLRRRPAPVSRTWAIVISGSGGLLFSLGLVAGLWIFAR